jgi:hypothetical protein
VVFEDFIYDDEMMKWVLIDEFESNNDKTKQENIILGQSTII